MTRFHARLRVMALPSLHGLRAFEVAARHMSFTLAAAELNVTQTAISHQIRRLEEQLGVPLFIRRNRTLLLTREAIDYLPSIRAAFEDLRRATERLQRSDHAGLLTVSTTASLATNQSDFQTLIAPIYNYMNTTGSRLAPAKFIAS